MRLRFAITVDVDVKGWERDYGVSTENGMLREDVQNYLTSVVLECNDNITSPTKENPVSKASDYSKAALAALPTITQGQVDDLKIETKTERVWLSRLTREDGVAQDHQITVEHLRADGTWS